MLAFGYFSWSKVVMLEGFWESWWQWTAEHLKLSHTVMQKVKESDIGEEEEVRCVCFERLLCELWYLYWSESSCSKHDSDHIVKQQSADTLEEHSVSSCCDVHSSLVADYSDSDSSESVSGASLGRCRNQTSDKKPKLELPLFITGNDTKPSSVKLQFTYTSRDNSGSHLRFWL